MHVLYLRVIRSILIGGALQALSNYHYFFWPQSTTDLSGLISSEVVAENYRYQS